MRKTLTRVHHFNKSLKHTPLLILALAAILLSVNLCTTSDPLEVGLIERTDLQIEGDINMQAYLQSPQDDASADLIQLVKIGEPVSRIDIEMDLGSGYTLQLRINNDAATTIEEIINNGYTIYPPENIEDKQMYLTAEFRRGAESATYVSSLGNDLPPGININALNIECSDNIMVKGRLNNVVLYNNTDPGRSILINGSFVSALDFGYGIGVIK